MIADELRRQCDNFIELDELREVIGRPPRGEQARPPRAAAVTADEERMTGAGRAPSRRATARAARGSSPTGARTPRRHPDWFNGAVPSFGDPAARLLVARPRAGRRRRQPHRPPVHRRLRRRAALRHADAASASPTAASPRAPTTACELADCLVSNAVRCVPPREQARRRPRSPPAAPSSPPALAALPRLRAVALPRPHRARDAAARARPHASPPIRSRHGARHDIGRLAVFDSYHCSRYNTNTGRLTAGDVRGGLRRRARSARVAFRRGARIRPRVPIRSPDRRMDRTMPASLDLYLAAPRGFCAGVDRAIQIVEMALEKWGAPVYVRHEIVHNRFVVDGLRGQGRGLRRGARPSARPTGRWSSPPTACRSRCPPRPRRGSMLYVDATCPLVSKVHIEAERHHANGLQMVMIGHAGHPEVDRHHGPAAAGRGDPGRDRRRRRRRSRPRDPARLAYITQTTLSVDDTAEIVAALRGALPGDRRAAQGGHLLRHHQPPGGGEGDGAADRRAARHRRAQLVELAAAGRGRPPRRLRLCPAGAARRRHRLAGARGRARGRGHRRRRARPRCWSRRCIAAFRARYDVTERLVETAREDVEFKVPRILRTKVA